MVQVLASGKTGAQRYADNDVDKPCPALDDISIVQNFQRAFNETQGYCYSNEEGSEDSQPAEALAPITADNVSDYDKSLAQLIQTYVANNSYLEVDASSTANEIILAPRIINNVESPDGVNYAEATSLPFEYRDNLRFCFRATITNTAATKVKITGLNGLSAAIDIVDESGSDLVGGEIVINKFYEIVLSGTGGTKKAILLGRDSQIGRFNAIINGDFNIWQRGTSFSSVADATYTADRWLYSKVGSMVHDITRSSDVPTVAEAGRLFNYSLKIDCTIIDSSIAATDLCVIEQRVEGYNWLPLAQKIITLSFWVKATKTGTYCCFLRNSGSDRSIVSEYTINTADTWEYKTITFAASPSAGTWDYTNGIGSLVGFTLAMGSDYQAPDADAWQSSNYKSTSNQVNACDSADNDFYICGVQLQAGSAATPFEQRTIQEELELCQRYYEKSYGLATDIGTATSSGAGIGRVAGTNLSAHNSFKVNKRTSPTVTTYSTVTGDSGKVRNSSTSADVTTSISDQGEGGFNVAIGSLSDNQLFFWQWTADAEL